MLGLLSRRNNHVDVDLNSFPCHLTRWSENGDFQKVFQKVKKKNRIEDLYTQFGCRPQPSCNKEYQRENIDYTEMLKYLKLMVVPLQEIHAKEILHKDIKADNYVVTQVDEHGRPEELMLYDFGNSNRCTWKAKRK